MGRTVLPCAGDLSRTARNPGVPEMPYPGGVQGTRSAALPPLQGALSDRRRDPGDADRRGKTGRAGLAQGLIERGGLSYSPLSLTLSPGGEREVLPFLGGARVLARVLLRRVGLCVSDVARDLVVG